MVVCKSFRGPETRKTYIRVDRKYMCIHCQKGHVLRSLVPNVYHCRRLLLHHTLADGETETTKIKPMDQHHTDGNWSRDWTGIRVTPRPIFFPLPSFPADQWQRGKKTNKKAKELAPSEELRGW